MVSEMQPHRSMQPGAEAICKSLNGRRREMGLGAAVGPYAVSLKVVRERAAETLQSVEQTAGGVLDSAKEQVHTTLQAGQDAVRPRAF